MCLFIYLFVYLFIHRFERRYEYIITTTFKYKLTHTHIYIYICIRGLIFFAERKHGSLRLVDLAASKHEQEQLEVGSIPLGKML